MKIKTIFLVAAVFILPPTVFSQSNPLVKYIPADASMIISFNPVKMGKKVPGETFRKSMIYREMIKKDDGEIRAFLSDPAVSGIDFSNDLVLVITTDPSNIYAGTTVHLFGALKNEALFSLAVKKLSADGDTVRTYGTDKIMMNENIGSSRIAWNNEIFILNMGGNSQWKNETYSSTNDTTIFVDTLGYYADTVSQKDMDKKREIEKRDRLKMQRESFFDLLSRKPANAITTDAHFLTLMGTAGDIKMWSAGTSGAAFEKIPQLALLSKLKIFSGKSKTAVINFENGKIVAQSHLYLDEQLAALYKKYPPVSINTALTRRLPPGKLLALVNTSFNPEMGNDLMKKAGMQELMDSIKSALPFDLNLARGVFKNDMMLAVLKTDEVIAEDAVPGKMDGIQVFLAIPIADKAKFEILRNTAKRMLDSLKDSEMGEKMLKGFNPALKNNDDLLVFSLSPETATAFLNNPGSGTPPEWLQAYSQHPMVAGINIKELIAMIMGKKSKGVEDAFQKKTFDMFDQVVFYGGNFENESINTTMEFKFSDQNTNVLTQLFEMMNMMVDGNERTINLDGLKDMQADTSTLDKIEPGKKDNEPSPPPTNPPPKVTMEKFTPPVIIKDEEVPVEKHKTTKPKVKN